MKIIKASGDETNFNERKIEKSVMKAGAPKKLALEVAKNVRKKVHDGATTKEILNLTLKCLVKDKDIAARYDLKRAIMSLGPSGFPFEEFFSQVLRNHGYKATTNNYIRGKVVMQEVDIVARKNKVSMIETKYHNKKGIRTDTKVAMYTYARFLDIKSNPKYKFNEVWLVTNTRCTSQAKKYSKGVGLRVIGWSYPKNGNLQELIESKSLYPITIFKSISRPIKEKLFKAKIVLAKDLADHSVEELSRKTGLDKKTLAKILEDAKRICYNKR